VSAGGTRIGTALHHLDLAALRLVVAVVRSGSISGGAAASHLSTAAASQRISELEARLGAHLFRRHPRGVVPTAAGERVAAYARDVLSLTVALEEDLSDGAQQVRARVRLAANSSAIAQFLPDDLGRFLARHPDIRVQVNEEASRNIVEQLVAGAADLGIFEASYATPGIAHAAYRRDALALVVPRAHPLAPRRRIAFAAVLAHELISLRPDTAIQQQLLRAAAALCVPLRSRIEVHSFDAVCRMVEAGAGVGIVPLRAADLFVQAGRLHSVRLAEPWAARELRIGWARQRPLPAGSDVLLEHLRGPLGEQASSRRADSG
jgi:DNA-binding transcriptional LysR family regulator